MHRGLLDDHLQYWALRRAECARRPALHRSQAIAFARLDEVGRDAVDADDLTARLAAAGVAEIAPIAELLDRYRNRAELHAALGDPARAAALPPLEALAARPLHQLSLDEVIAALVAAESASTRAAVAQTTVTRALVALLHWRTEPHPVVADVHRLVLDYLWTQVSSLDPALSWTTLATVPAYRDRIPWALAPLQAWFDEAAGQPGFGITLPVGPTTLEELPPPEDDPDATAQTETTEPAEPPPPPDDPYLVEVRALTARRDALAVGVHPMTALLAAAREDLPARLARADLQARSARLRDHAVTRSQPHLIARGVELDAALASATTVAEIELAGVRWWEQVVIDADRSELLIELALRPLEIALGDSGAESGASAAAQAAVATLCGVTWAELLATAGLRDLIERVAIGVGADRSRAPLAGTIGEAGLSCAQLIRGALDDPRTPAAHALAAAPLTWARFEQIVAGLSNRVSLPDDVER